MFLYAVKIQSKCSQNSAKIQSKCSQNAVKIQAIFSQNSVKIQPKSSHNSVKIQSVLGVLVTEKFSVLFWDLKISLLYQFWSLYTQVRVLHFPLSTFKCLHTSLIKTTKSISIFSSFFLLQDGMGKADCTPDVRNWIVRTNWPELSPLGA